ncbi:hypothetical protein CROQUDRAFT_108730 [Cronartium quercuum f. sp. fusiforme G11]|uniref:Uncharacterized protein n=1 Tax=Cronartium quercuum f. sp. fusiforme G11 TaxID=708437 RepID=A0A9P6NCB0_9BASI|nr:hypothetical protein CROQUDRAFT_108730 [Cronartium quercuum f. sp. fusiforme G11]
MWALVNDHRLPYLFKTTFRQRKGGTVVTNSKELSFLDGDWFPSLSGECARLAQRDLVRFEETFMHDFLKKGLKLKPTELAQVLRFSLGLVCQVRRSAWTYTSEGQRMMSHWLTICKGTPTCCLGRDGLRTRQLIATLMERVFPLIVTVLNHSPLYLEGTGPTARTRQERRLIDIRILERDLAFDNLTRVVSVCTPHLLIVKRLRYLGTYSFVAWFENFQRQILAV